MPWPLIAQLIINEGIPVAEAIFKKWSSGAEPTAADFDELRGLASTTAVERLKAKLTAKGIPLDSDQAKQLIALAS